MLDADYVSTRQMVDDVRAAERFFENHPNELAASIPIRTAIQTFSLADGNEALRRLASGDLEATAVLVIGERSAASP